MDRITMEHFEVEKEKFDHFLNGDGEIWFDFNDGMFLTKEEVIQAFKDNACETEEDQKVIVMNLVYKEVIMNLMLN